MNEAKLDLFICEYAKWLREYRNQCPNEYEWPVEMMDTVLERMSAAIRRGSFSKDGKAFAATCKVLGIKNTYKAISEYLER